MTKAEEILRKEITIIESSLQPDMQQMIRRSDALRAVEEAINYTHCCKSDSEQLLAFGKELLPRKQHFMLDKHIALFLKERSK